MGDSHSENGEFVRLASQGAAGGHHITELIDIGGHLVAAATLYLTVALSVVRRSQTIEVGD